MKFKSCIGHERFDSVLDMKHMKETPWNMYTFPFVVVWDVVVSSSVHMNFNDVFSHIPSVAPVSFR